MIVDLNASDPVGAVAYLVCLAIGLMGAGAVISFFGLVVLFVAYQVNR